MLYEERSDGKGAKSNSYVDNLKSPREKRKFSTWARNETSEESNETSEESKRPHVENVLFLKKVHSWEGVTETVLGLFLLFL